MLKSASPTSPRREAQHRVLRTASSRPTPADVPAARPAYRSLLVPYVPHRGVTEHDELAPLLADGWTVHGAHFRLVEGCGLHLFVRLRRC